MADEQAPPPSPESSPAPAAAPPAPTAAAEPVGQLPPMVSIGNFAFPKKTAIMAGSGLGALLLLIILMFVFSGEEPAPEAIATPAATRPSTVQTPVPGAPSAKRSGPGLHEVLPEGTLACAWTRDIGKLVPRAKDLGVWRWLNKSGLRPLAGQGWNQAVDEERSGARASLPERLSEIDPLTQGCLQFLESPRDRLERAGKLFPGEVVAGIVGFNNKGNIMPIPHILVVADVSNEVDETWLDVRLDRLLNYFHVQDANSAFTVSRVRNNEDDLDVSYFRVGDKASSFSVGIWKKRLILSNDDLVFRRALRAVHGLGAPKKTEEEGAGPRSLVDTLTWRQLAMKMDPRGDDAHVYIQNQMVGKLIGSTLPVDSTHMKLDDMIGIQQCQAMAASVRLEGYAFRERLAWVYAGGLPEESLLSFLNKLPQGQRLAACAPESSVAAWNFHLDMGSAWDAWRRFDNATRPSSKATDLETLIETMELGYNLYPDKLLKDFDSEKLVYATRQDGQLALGALLAIKPKTMAHIKMLSAPALMALGSRWKGQVEVERRPLGAHPALCFKFKSAPEIPGSPLMSLADHPLAGELVARAGILREIHACLLEGHVALATSRAELEALVKRVPLALKSKPTPACPALADAMARFTEPSQSLLWFDTPRAVSALQRKGPAMWGSLMPGLSITALPLEELTPLMPPTVTALQVMEVAKRKGPAGSVAMPTGIYVESFVPLPAVTPLFLSWALESRLGVIFGSGEQKKP